MKINNLNKRLLAGLMGGIILSTPLALTSCSSYSYVTEDDGSIHLDKDKIYEYGDVKQLEIVVLEINGKENIYLGVSIYYNWCYEDVFTGKRIYDDQGDEVIDGVKLISHESIEKYLISYNMLKEEYSVEDLEILFKRIKNDYYIDNKDKTLVKK